MCKSLIIFILLLITQCVRAQKLNHELSKLLFDVDISSLDTTLITSFGEISSLEKINHIDTFIIHREREHSSYFYTLLLNSKKIDTSKLHSNLDM
jgi:hypothetical protein